MTLFAHETTVGEAIDEIGAEIAEVDDELETVDPDASVHDALAAARNSLVQQRDIFEAYVAQDEWDADAEIVLSSVSAGERALVNREMPDEAGSYERTLWTVAAATDAAPWHEATVAESVESVSALEAPVVDWCETVIAGLRGDGHPLTHLRQTIRSQQ